VQHDIGVGRESRISFAPLGAVSDHQRDFHLLAPQGSSSVPLPP